MKRPHVTTCRSIWRSISGCNSNCRCCCSCRRSLRFKKLFCRHVSVALFVYAVTFLIVMPALCDRLPYSGYYVADQQKDFQMALAANENRVNAAEDYLKSLDAASTLGQYRYTPGGAEDVHMVVAVVTVARTKNKNVDINPKYLTQGLSRVDIGLRRHRYQHNNKIIICNVDSNPTAHAEAIELSKYFPMVNKSSIVKNPPCLNNDCHTKERDDYVFCLNWTLQYKSKYVLFLQDDALPHDGFYEDLNSLLENRVERRYARGEYIGNNEKWAYVKLNFPTPLAGFEAHWWFFLEGVSIAIVGASVVSLLYETLWRQGSSVGLQWTYAVFLASFVYFGILSQAVGRQQFLRLRSLFQHSIRPATSCCLTAVLYPSIMVPDIIHYLEAANVRGRYPLDFALADFVEESGATQYLAMPNLFTHIVCGWRSFVRLAITVKKVYEAAVMLLNDQVSNDTFKDPEVQTPRPASSSLARWILVGTTSGSTVLILFGNLLVIVAVFRQQKLRKSATNLFIASVSVSDIGVGVLYNPIGLARLFDSEGLATEFLCKAGTTVSWTFINATIFLLLCIAIDRYRAIVTPTKRKITAKQAWGMIILAWVTSFALSSNYIPSTGIVSKTVPVDGQNVTKKSCQYVEGEYDIGTIVIAEFVFTYFLPLLIICVLYAKMISVLYLGNSPNDQSRRRKRRAVRMLVVVVAMFAITWSPLRVRRILFYSLRGIISRATYTILQAFTAPLAIANSWINPLVYAIFGSNFRREFVSILTCSPARDDAQPAGKANNRQQDRQKERRMPSDEPGRISSKPSNTPTADAEEERRPPSEDRRPMTISSKPTVSTPTADREKNGAHSKEVATQTGGADGVDFGGWYENAAYDAVAGFLAI